jgi:formate C-acetyltransferase
MNERVAKLRQESLRAQPSLCLERAEIVTEVYATAGGHRPPPLLRAQALMELCARKTIYIGPEELIVGERGASPKATPTYPEVTCHSLADLRALGEREKIRFSVDEEFIRVYGERIIPFWQGRSLRDRLFDRLPAQWHDCFAAGLFTEFLEQRAPGHTVMDGKIYHRGLLGFKADIEDEILRRRGDESAETGRQVTQLEAMALTCDALLLLAQRHADEARRQAASETDRRRREELLSIARVCQRVPAEAPRNFWEALQMYWFVHLGVVLELNGWDAFSPGHLDQHLAPFYEQDFRLGQLTRARAKELLGCLWVKFNNQPAPPKVGVTAAESSTYNDFVNINLAGQLQDGRDGVSEVSYLILEVVDEMHLLQPGSNVQLSRKTPDEFLQATSRVIRQGYGYPSLFNSEGVVEILQRQGKSLEDARRGGTSGCVETGCFGKEAYFLTGYVNLPKVLELVLHRGIDPRTGRQVGVTTAEPRSFVSVDEVLEAFRQQLVHVIETKLEGNRVFERAFAQELPAPFLSVLIDDCIACGRDYHDGGARYNTSYVQGVGIGTITDSLSALAHHVFGEGTVTMAELLAAMDDDFAQAQWLRLLLSRRTPRYGNDDDRADVLMQQVFGAFLDSVEGRPNQRGGHYHILMLPTTSHIYFGSLVGATADGRPAGAPLSEGISPVQGADRLGPTAVLKSAAKMNQRRTGGTLLNLKFLPHVVAHEKGLTGLGQLIRSYFELGGHHIQFNVVDAQLLREAQADPESHRDLIVRVAGYSDYFCDLSRELQDEIIARTAHGDAL